MHHFPHWTRIQKSLISPTFPAYLLRHDVAQWYQWDRTRLFWSSCGVIPTPVSVLHMSFTENLLNLSILTGDDDPATRPIFILNCLDGDIQRVNAVPDVLVC